MVFLLLVLLLAAWGGREDAGKREETREDTYREEKEAATELPAEGRPRRGRGITVSETKLMVEALGENGFLAREVRSQARQDAGCIVLYPPARQTGKPVEVVYTERTVFLIRAPWDGRGVTDREGTAADLEKGSRILLSGVREGDVLYASRIVITGF